MLCLYFSCSPSTCSPFPPLFTLISMLPIGNLADLFEYIKAKSKRIKVIYCKTFQIRMVFKWTYKWKGCSLFQVFHILCCLSLGWKSSSNLLTALDWGNVNVCPLDPQSLIFLMYGSFIPIFSMNFILWLISLHSFVAVILLTLFLPSLILPSCCF